MKCIFTCCLFFLSCGFLSAQLPPWNLEFYVFHPGGQTDTLWVGCDENATNGYDEGLDVIDTTFNTPIAIRGFSQEVEDAFNFNTCVNLKKDIRPFGYPAEFTFYILHDEISTSDSVYLGWDTSMLNYEVGEYKIYTAKLESVNGYIEGIDGIEYFIGYQDSDTIFNYGYQPIPLFILGEYLDCILDNSVYIIKLTFIVKFKDYSLDIDNSLQLLSNKIAIYPNPSSSLLFIDYNLDVLSEALIYDLNGNVISSFAIKFGKQQINISTLPSGNYYIKIFSVYNIELFNLKFIKI